MADEGTWAEKGVAQKPAPASAVGKKKTKTDDGIGEVFLNKSASTPSSVMSDLGTRPAAQEDNQTLGLKYDRTTPDMDPNQEVNKRKNEKKRFSHFIRSGLK
jgi:hypothetical protein